MGLDVLFSISVLIVTYSFHVPVISKWILFARTVIINIYLMLNINELSAKAFLKKGFVQREYPKSIEMN